MRVGILGSGLMGGKLGTIFARARTGSSGSDARRPSSTEGTDLGKYRQRSSA